MYAAICTEIWLIELVYSLSLYFIWTKDIFVQSTYLAASEIMEVIENWLYLLQIILTHIPWSQTATYMYQHLYPFESCCPIIQILLVSELTALSSIIAPFVTCIFPPIYYLSSIRLMPCFLRPSC